jgi:cytidylate kinase
MIITISGDPGSGKSTVRNILSKIFNLKKYSVGDMRGKMAIERGMTIDELNKLGEKKEFTDKEADKYQTTLGEKEDNFIIDGRLSYHFIPKSIKIFIKVELEEGAKRIFGDKREDEKKAKSVLEEKERIIERIESDQKRYKKYYGINYQNENNFDIVIDSTNISAEEVARKIIKHIKQG